MPDTTPAPDPGAQVAYRIRAELVCCHIYDRVNDAHELTIQQAMDGRDWHDLCYWGEASARIAEGRCPGYETDPNVCRCTCTGCRTNCGAHDETHQWTAPASVPVQASSGTAQDGLADAGGGAHSCSNCEGIDPDTCLGNPDRPRAAPRSGIRGLLAHVGLDVTGRDITVDGKLVDAWDETAPPPCTCGTGSGSPESPAPSSGEPGDDLNTAPADATLRDRIRSAIHDADDHWCSYNEGADYDALTTAVLAAMQPVLDELADYRHRLNWLTTCGGCARLLDSCYAETMRAEQAEELLRIAHETANQSEAARQRAVHRAETAETAEAERDAALRTSAREAAAMLRRTPRDSRDYPAVLTGARVIETWLAATLTPPADQPEGSPR